MKYKHWHSNTLVNQTLALCHANTGALMPVTQNQQCDTTGNHNPHFDTPIN